MPHSETGRGLAALRDFVRQRPEPSRTETPAEQCGLCSQRLASEHRHLLESERQGIICACDPCALRFHDVLDGRFKLIPRDARSLPGFRMEDPLWESMAIPINLAFFFRSTPHERVVALYPGPAGVTESLLRLDAWNELEADNPGLRSMKPDVEALLVNRVGENRTYLLAPIDACFRLAGLIRLHWQGFSGGRKVWKEIEHFFNELGRRAIPLPPLSQETDHA